MESFKIEFKLELNAKIRKYSDENYVSVIVLETEVKNISSEDAYVNGYLAPMYLNFDLKCDGKVN